MKQSIDLSVFYPLGQNKWYLPLIQEFALKCQRVNSGVYGVFCPAEPCPILSDQQDSLDGCYYIGIPASQNLVNICRCGCILENRRMHAATHQTSVHIHQSCSLLYHAPWCHQSSQFALDKCHYYAKYGWHGENGFIWLAYHLDNTPNS